MIPITIDDIRQGRFNAGAAGLIVFVPSAAVPAFTRAITRPPGGYSQVLSAASLMNTAAVVDHSGEDSTTGEPGTIVEAPTPVTSSEQETSPITSAGNAMDNEPTTTTKKCAICLENAMNHCSLTTTNTFQCRICLKNAMNNEPTATKCGHVFCGPCIKLALNARNKCPSCQRTCTQRTLVLLHNSDE